MFRFIHSQRQCYQTDIVIILCGCAGTFLDNEYIALQDALLGREEALDMTDPLANLTEINRNIKKEIELQFEV